jgi:dipeptidyl aminopeptidase/acylaminoacyl peptidase
MSATEQIDGSEPPFIVLHGTADTSNSSVMSERFAAALERAGFNAELVRVPDADHAFERKPLTGPKMTMTLARLTTS